MHHRGQGYPYTAGTPDTLLLPYLYLRRPVVLSQLQGFTWHWSGLFSALVFFGTWYLVYNLLCSDAVHGLQCPSLSQQMLFCVQSVWLYVCLCIGFTCTDVSPLLVCSLRYSWGGGVCQLLPFTATYQFSRVWTNCMSFPSFPSFILVTLSQDIFAANWILRSVDCSQFLNAVLDAYVVEICILMQIQQSLKGQSVYICIPTMERENWAMILWVVWLTNTVQKVYWRFSIHEDILAHFCFDPYGSK